MIHFAKSLLTVAILGLLIMLGGDALFLLGQTYDISWMTERNSEWIVSIVLTALILFYYTRITVDRETENDGTIANVTIKWEKRSH